MANIEDLKEVADTLVRFAESPLDFLREYVLVILVGSLLSIVEGVMLQIWAAWQTLTQVVLGNAAAAVAESFLTVGRVPFMILSAIDELLVIVAQAGGPIAPIIYAGAWAIVLVLTLEAIKFAAEKLYQFVVAIT